MAAAGELGGTAASTGARRDFTIGGTSGGETLRLSPRTRPRATFVVSRFPSRAASRQDGFDELLTDGALPGRTSPGRECLRESAQVRRGTRDVQRGSGRCRVRLTTACDDQPRG